MSRAPDSVRSSTPPPASEHVELLGIAGSPGVSIGSAVVLGRSRTATPRRHIQPSEIDPEIERYRNAVHQTQHALRDLATRHGERRVETSILDAYELMLGDELLAEAVIKLVRDEQRCAEWAVQGAIDSLAARLGAVDDPYLRERSHDVEFVGERLLRALRGDAETVLPKFVGPSIVIAHDLSPADTASMVREPVVGFVTEVGTRTSHTSIMARTLEIPAVVGIADALARVATGDTVVVDGSRGVVIVNPTPEEIADAKSRAERHQAWSKDLHRSHLRPAETKDGVRIALRANVELPEEAALARDHGAEGIGLYRTEFLYVDRLTPPGEDEQFEVFRSVIEAMKPRPVTLRTFDIGGDKFVSTFQVPPEMNPMLGLRAVRLALSRPDVFLEHLRAMARATALGDVRIMIPMVASLGELRQVKRLLHQAKAEVVARGHACAEEIPLGVMIEVPAAAVLVDLFAREAAFLSLGTNDLIQYALAVDRTSQSMAYLASPFDPSIVRLIAGVVRAGATWQRPVSLCGAMASDPFAALLLIGLGVRDFSMEAPAIAEMKEVFSRVGIAEAEAVARQALELGTAEEIEACVRGAFEETLRDLLEAEEGIAPVS